MASAIMALDNFICCLALLAALVRPLTSSAATTVEFVTPPSQWNTSERQAAFFARAAAGDISNLRCWISALSPEHGDPAARDAFECAAPEKLAAGTIGQITLKLSSPTSLKRGLYTATLQVLGTDGNGAVVTQTVTFKAIVPAVALKVGETDTIRVRLVRPWPFSAVKGTIPVGLRVISDSVPEVLPKPATSQLYVQDGDVKAVVSDGYLTAVFTDTPRNDSKDPGTTLSANAAKDRASTATDTDPQLLNGKTFSIKTSIPSEVQKASGVVRLQSPEFAADIETPVTLLVKDYWLWAAIVVFLGQLLSFWVNNWVTVGRQRKLNSLDLEPLESAIINFLIGRPDLEKRKEVADLYVLLDKAAQSNRLGDVESAKKSIKDAADKFDQFSKNPPALEPSSEPSSIVMLQRSHAYPARWLHFILVNPNPSWSSTATYKWEWSGQRPTYKELAKQALTGSKEKTVRDLSKEYLDKQQWRVLYEAQNLRDISERFWKAGQYILKLSVDGVQGAVLSFRLDKDPSTGFLSRIAASDKAVLLLAVVFAAILSYLAIDKLETFGSVSDYALAFLGGFGLNATTSGFNAVVSRFKAGAA